VLCDAIVASSRQSSFPELLNPFNSRISKPLQDCKYRHQHFIHLSHFIQNYQNQEFASSLSLPASTMVSNPSSTGSANSRDTVPQSIVSYSAVVMDIEGTTTDISFVKNTLFPYARLHAEDFLREAMDHQDPEILPVISMLVEQSDLDAFCLANVHQVPVTDPALLAGDFFPIDLEHSLDSIVRNVHWQISHDRKTQSLKALQGFIWRSGYASGALQGHVYDDILPMFLSWHQLGIPLYIYSSGSISAQKLLFQNTRYGDLTCFLQGHFDTTTGSKVDASSYLSIAECLEREHNIQSRSEILFLTDLSKEVEAARAAGYQVAQLIRPGFNGQPVSEVPNLVDFLALLTPCVVRPYLETINEIKLNP
jgi:enolase-phosphatase E1